jgi:hypothetical protein
MTDAERDAFAVQHGFRPISEFDSTGSHKRVVFLHWSADDTPQICLRQQQAIHYLPKQPADATADTPVDLIVEWSTATHFKET